MSKSSNLELRMKWEQRIADYKASGLTQVKWCEENHISIHQFKYWMKQIKRQQPQNNVNGHIISAKSSRFLSN